MKNTTELIGFYGSDESHALSAWTSTTRDIESKRERIPALLKMLAENGHHTPFEKSTLHFLVRCDLASQIHLLKHRVAVSINGESARYKELKEDKYYLPDDWEGVDYMEESWAKILKQFSEDSNAMYHKCLEEITPILGRKRAKESARYFKLYNTQTTLDISFNFRSFMHFQGLRNKPDAQKEIREIAQSMLTLVQNIEGNPFEHSLKAFGYDSQIN